jgi:hypothetical protein
MAVSLFANWKWQRQVGIVRLEGDRLQRATARPSLFDGSRKTALIRWRRAEAKG